MKTLLVFLNLGSLSSILLNQNVISYLKASGTWAKISDHVWLIKTYSTPPMVRDGIRNSLGNMSTTSDQLLVLDVSKSEWASYNFSSEVTDWIKANF